MLGNHVQTEMELQASVQAPPPIPSIHSHTAKHGQIVKNNVIQDKEEHQELHTTQTFGLPNAGTSMGISM